MTYETSLLFTLFIIMISIELFMIARIIYVNPRGRLNIQLFFASLMLYSWSIKLCIFNSRYNMLVSLFWRGIIGLLFQLIIRKILRKEVERNNSYKLILEISFEFVSANKVNLDKKINNTLKSMGEFFDVDGTYIFTINKENNSLSYIYKWCNHILNKSNGRKNLDLDIFPIWMERIENENLIYIKNVEKLPIEALSEREELMKLGIKSVLVVPIKSISEIIGFLGLVSIKKFKRWSDRDVDILTIIGNILSDGVIKIRSEREIEYMAYYDHLTGLANRTLFTNRLKETIKIAEKDKGMIAVIFIDLDSFKRINDSMGHSGGDKVLKKVAENLRAVVDKTDTVARFAGDEFLIMIDKIESKKDVENMAEKIINTFKKPFTIDKHRIFITGSAGIAIYPMDGYNVESLIKNADIAMYHAKKDGKNKYIICTEDMKEKVKKDLILSKDLFKAREREELIIYYQPQVNLKTNKIVGFEALLRWNHPNLGMVAPSVFIPLAEKNGTIDKIGQWVIKTACQQNMKWQGLGLDPIRMAVNISVVQLNNPFIVERIKDIIDQTQIDPKYLELEITEGVAVKKGAHVVNILNKLKDIGVSIAIDDFGTEYSSLSRLKALPIDRIKIDMKFIHGIDKDYKDQAIIKTIINLAKSLKLQVIAEGVETERQVELLNKKMCDDGQGYYYYKPMPAEDMEKLLLEESLIKNKLTNDLRS